MRDLIAAGKTAQSRERLLKLDARFRGLTAPQNVALWNSLP
jgi:hypothetical protein